MTSKNVQIQNMVEQPPIPITGVKRLKSITGVKRLKFMQ